MEPQSPLIRTERGVELDAVAAVDLDFALVGFPDDAELDHAFGNGDYLEGGAVLGVVGEEGAVFEGGDEFWGMLAGKDWGKGERGDGEGKKWRGMYLCKLARTRARRGGWT